MLFSKMSMAQAIGSLKEACFFTLDREPSEREMSKLISRVEKRFPDSGSYELEFWLGSVLRNYTALFVRGEERREYLEKAVQHFERAYELSQDAIPQELPPREKRDFGSFDRNTIACEIGSLLINEAIIRDLERGMFYLEIVFGNSNAYYPQLCAYADGFYKMGDYLKAAEVALEIHRRAENSPECDGILPSAPMSIVAKAYRSKAKEHKKQGETRQALALFQQLVEMGLATDNDRKLLQKLQTRGNIDGSSA